MSDPQDERSEAERYADKHYPYYPYINSHPASVASFKAGQKSDAVMALVNECRRAIAPLNSEPLKEAAVIMTERWVIVFNALKAFDQSVNEKAGG